MHIIIIVSETGVWGVRWTHVIFFGIVMIFFRYCFSFLCTLYVDIMHHIRRAHITVDDLRDMKVRVCSKRGLGKRGEGGRSPFRRGQQPLHHQSIRPEHARRGTGRSPDLKCAHFTTVKNSKYGIFQSIFPSLRQFTEVQGSLYSPVSI